MTKQQPTTLPEGALFLDVRPQTAYEEGHLEGATNLPLEALPMAELPEDKEQPIYVHCRLGIKSKEAKAILEEKGYTQVVDLGAIDNLVEQGFTYTDPS